MVKKTSILKVYFNGRLVGFLKKGRAENISFEYNKDWLSWEHSLPVSMSLGLKDAPFVGKDVLAVFDNLLPDNDVLRQKIATKYCMGRYDTFSVLSGIGRDCVGAFHFIPEEESFPESSKISGKVISDEEIGKRVSLLSNNPLGMDKNEEFRISVAGVQEKTALLFWENAWCIPKGSTATTHILKPEIGNIKGGMDLSDSVENEYFCMKLSRALGLDVAEVDIKRFSNVKVLVVKRFDRLITSDNRIVRVHQEDLCQALSVLPGQKYQSDGGPDINLILKFLLSSDSPFEDRYNFLKAQIVFWLLSATDGHAKNFSIFLYPGGKFSLTPLYDIMSIQPYLDKKQITKNKVKLAMSVGNNAHYRVDNILPRHFVETANKNGIDKDVVFKIFDELIEISPNIIREVTSILPEDFPSYLVKSITTGFLNRLELIKKFK